MAKNTLLLMIVVMFALQCVANKKLYQIPGEIKYRYSLNRPGQSKYYTKLNNFLIDLETQTKEYEILDVHFESTRESRCYLPLDGSEDSENEDQEEEEEITINGVMEPLSEKCLFRMEGWWTYEFCYGSYIKQFHQNEDGTVGMTFLLGYKEHEKSKESSLNPTYYSEFYDGGTKCDIENVDRGTEVRYACARTKESFIHKIEEPRTCRYIFYIYTPHVCKYPLYKPEVEPSDEIQCFELPYPSSELMKQMIKRDQHREKGYRKQLNPVDKRMKTGKPIPEHKPTDTIPTETIPTEIIHTEGAPKKNMIKELLSNSDIDMEDPKVEYLEIDLTLEDDLRDMIELLQEFLDSSNFELEEGESYANGNNNDDTSEDDFDEPSNVKKILKEL
eukprot:TRINITY_DN7884_c0_g1_i1.p1 TRINITY_DN7884_c0_g1~~TRINITY_DN7884_c0_g1_i1.p1  ORF type:complete len:389 (+),score=112.08 TRINITY_DN7884_c0_g1_i1:282-1448(+)